MKKYLYRVSLIINLLVVSSALLIEFIGSGSTADAFFMAYVYMLVYIPLLSISIIVRFFSDYPFKKWWDVISLPIVIYILPAIIHYTISPVSIHIINIHFGYLLILPIVLILLQLVNSKTNEETGQLPIQIKKQTALIITGIVVVMYILVTILINNISSKVNFSDLSENELNNILSSKIYSQQLTDIAFKTTQGQYYISKAVAVSYLNDNLDKLNTSDKTKLHDIVFSKLSPITYDDSLNKIASYELQFEIMKKLDIDKAIPALKIIAIESIPVNGHLLRIVVDSLISASYQYPEKREEIKNSLIEIKNKLNSIQWSDDGNARFILDGFLK